ncbi:MAG: Protease HtpX [Phycisphaerae bacterium]|nr:Protease HtpX [Phycisphaerae bacterium]
MQVLAVISLAMTLMAMDPQAMQLSHDLQLHADALTRGLVVLAGCLAFVLAALLFNMAAARRLDRDGSMNRRRYRRGLMLLTWAMIVLFGAQLYWADWAAVVLSALHLRGWPLVAEMTVWAPFVAMLMGFWASAWLVDVRLRLMDIQRRLEAGLPVHAAGGRPVWGLGGFMAFQIRFHLLLVLVPLLAILLIHAGLDRLFPSVSRLLERWGLDAGQRGAIYGVALLGIVLGVFMVAPVMLAAVLSTRPLDDGPLRSGLESSLSRLGVKVRRILLWRTGGMVSNAAVMGLWGRLRYVLLSDGLIETLPDEQIEGVFGHELGHVTHHHIFYYLLFVAAGAFWIDLTAGTLLQSQWFSRLEASRPAISTAVEAGYWVLVAVGGGMLFGWLSRRFERQADLTGAQAISLDGLAHANLMPAAWAVEAGPGGDETVVVVPTDPGDAPPAARRVDLAAVPHPAAIEVYSAALLRIAQINGMDRNQHTWRHGSIQGRCDHLRRLAEPARFRRFNVVIGLAKLGILLACFGGLLLQFAAGS